MTWVAENWEVIFGGVGTAVVVAVLGVILKKRKPAQDASSQTIESGDNSTNIQVGRDYHKGPE